MGDNGFIDLIPFKKYTIDNFSPSIIKDDSKCIRCQRCVRTCTELQSISALTVAHKGKEMKISSFYDKPMYEVVCTNCGQCVNRCPTGALTEKIYIDQVWEAICAEDKHVVVQTAPAVRVALGEALGMEPGEIITGKLVVITSYSIHYTKLYDLIWELPGYMRPEMQLLLPMKLLLLLWPLKI